MFPWEESNSRSASKDRMDLKGGYQEDGSTQGWGEKYDQSDGDRERKGAHNKEGTSIIGRCVIKSGWIGSKADNAEPFIWTEPLLIESRNSLGI